MIFIFVIFIDYYFQKIKQIKRQQTWLSPKLEFEQKLLELQNWLLSFCAKQSWKMWTDNKDWKVISAILEFSFLKVKSLI